MIKILLTIAGFAIIVISIAAMNNDMIIGTFTMLGGFGLILFIVLDMILDIKALKEDVENIKEKLERMEKKS